jgi:hypothetical protein
MGAQKEYLRTLVQAGGWQESATLGSLKKRWSRQVRPGNKSGQVRSGARRNLDLTCRSRLGCQWARGAPESFLRPRRVTVAAASESFRRVRALNRS